MVPISGKESRLGQLGFDSDLVSSRVCALSFCVEGETRMQLEKGRN